MPPYQLPMLLSQIPQLTFLCKQSSEPTLSNNEKNISSFAPQNVGAASDPSPNCYQKSSITENWPCNMKNSEVALRYIIYRQPLSLDRYIHSKDFPPQFIYSKDFSFTTFRPPSRLWPGWRMPSFWSVSTGCRTHQVYHDFAFTIFMLRFQQIIGVHTLQAYSEQIKVCIPIIQFL